MTNQILKELDYLLETQGRLQFARLDYNEKEAEAFGVALLDFVRIHGVDLRAAIAAYGATDTPASVGEHQHDAHLSSAPDAAVQRQEKPAGSAACSCSLRTRLVGDGCSRCNPEPWAESLLDEFELASHDCDAYERGGVRIPTRVTARYFAARNQLLGTLVIAAKRIDALAADIKAEGA